jgi:hypothetical protein
VHFIGRDFLDLDATNLDQRFDGIVLNPPFENRQEIDHILRAYKFLAFKGVLAAIISEGAFFRADTQSVAFRDFLESRKAQVISLPSGSFASSGTQVNCRMIRIDADS